jgi:tripeptidyl-peptidase-1
MPHPDTLKLVSSWLGYSGVQPSSISTTHGGGWLTVADVLVCQANKLLGASYQLYHHAGTNETIIRTVGYALPAALHIHVQTVAPMTAFTSTRIVQQTPRSRSGGAAAQAANGTSGEPVDMLSHRAQGLVDPSFLRSVYKTYGYTPAATDRNVLGIAGLLNDYPSQEDLTAFMTQYRDDAEDATFTSVMINGGYPNHPTLGASLDTQYSGAIAYPTPIIYYTIGGTPQRSPNGGPGPNDAYLQ